MERGRKIPKKHWKPLLGGMEMRNVISNEEKIKESMQFLNKIPTGDKKCETTKTIFAFFCGVRGSNWRQLLEEWPKSSRRKFLRISGGSGLWWYLTERDLIKWGFVGTAFKCGGHVSHGLSVPTAKICNREDLSAYVTLALGIILPQFQTVLLWKVSAVTDHSVFRLSAAWKVGHACPSWCITSESSASFLSCEIGICQTAVLVYALDFWYERHANSYIWS